MTKKNNGIAVLVHCEGDQYFVLHFPKCVSQEDDTKHTFKSSKMADAQQRQKHWSGHHPTAASPTDNLWEKLCATTHESVSSVLSRGQGCQEDTTISYLVPILK